MAPGAHFGIHNTSIMIMDYLVRGASPCLLQGGETRCGIKDIAIIRPIVV